MALHSKHIYYLLLMKALKDYEMKDEGFRKNAFPLVVMIALRELNMPELAEKARNDPALAYQVAHKLVEDYFTMKNDIRISFMPLDRLAEGIEKGIEKS